MNATKTEKVYSVVAEFYNGSTLTETKVLKELKMAPGTDGVDTGIVTLENGQSVRVYLRNDSKPDAEDNGNVAPNTGDSKKNNTLFLAVTIVGVVVFLVLIVVAVMIVLKKPAAAEEKKENNTEK